MADIDELKKKLEDGWIKGEPYVFVSLKRRFMNLYMNLENVELMYI